MKSINLNKPLINALIFTFLLSILALSGCFPVETSTQVPTTAPTITMSPTSENPTTTPTITISPTSNNPTPSVVVHTSTPYPSGYVILEEGFESGLENIPIVIEESGWQVQEDEEGNHFLCNYNEVAPGLRIRISNELGMNYQFKFEVKDTKFNYIRSEILALAVQRTDSSFYGFLILFVGYQDSTQTFTTDASGVHFYKNLPSGGSTSGMTKSFFPPLEDQWYSVSISLDQGNISFSWDDELVIEYYDSDYLTEGQITIGTEYGTCIDNIKIISIGNPENE